MLKLRQVRKVAVTGGIACGKSTVCSIFKELGAKVISADEIVHQQLSPNTKLGQQVINLIGSDVVDNHQINRSKIAAKVFKQPKLLKALENLTHPFVRNEIIKQIQEVEKEKIYPMIVVEIPLLFESGFQDLFDATIAVNADPEISLQRFIKSKGTTEEDYNQRKARQLPVDVKCSQADFTINNNGSLESLKENVKIVFDTIKNLNQPTTN